MQRNDSLYINVLDVPNILAAIDLAEEQLLSGIDFAMSRNVVGEKTDEDTDDDVSLLEQHSVRKPPVKENRKESTDVYSAGAELVDRRKAHRQEAGGAPSKDSISSDRSQSDVILVRDEKSKSGSGDRAEVEFVGIKKAQGWNRALQPGRSVLAKREANGQGANEHISAKVSRNESKIVDTSLADNVANNETDIAELASDRGKNSDMARMNLKSSTKPRPHRRIAPSEASAMPYAKVDADIPTRTLNGPSMAKGKSTLRTGSPKVHAKAVKEAGSTFVDGQVRNEDELKPLMRAISSKAKMKLPSSDPTPKQQAQMVVPGVMYIPNAKVIGTALPNGYKSTLEGLRPVVTLDPRPKVPLQLRQTIADKLFQTLLDAGWPEMECIVNSIMTEQR
jgi:hypothetical protein